MGFLEKMKGSVMALKKPYGEGSGMILRTCGKMISKLDLLISIVEKKSQKERLKKLRKKTKKLKKRFEVDGGEK
jgi:hypothetical protein